MLALHAGMVLCFVLVAGAHGAALEEGDPGDDVPAVIKPLVKDGGMWGFVLGKDPVPNLPKVLGGAGAGTINVASEQAARTSQNSQQKEDSPSVGTSTSTVNSAQSLVQGVADGTSAASVSTGTAGTAQVDAAGARAASAALDAVLGASSLNVTALLEAAKHAKAALEGTLLVGGTGDQGSSSAAASSSTATGPSTNTVQVADASAVKTDEQVAVSVEPASSITTKSLACEASGYCSLEHVKPFSGDVWPSEGMKASLEARSYKKELILVAETRLTPAFQLYDNLRNMGFGHVLLLVQKPEKCEKSTRVLPELGCAWSSQRFIANEKYLMDRVAYLARAVRLGANVMMLDTDVVWFDDPYVHLKAPPLRDIHYLAMRDGNGWVNCGVVYIQNARPDGPAAFAIADIVDRTIRWGENGTHLGLKTPPRGGSCWDQMMYSDTLLSVIAGRPVYYGCWQPHGETRERMWHEAHNRLFPKLPPHEGLGSALYLEFEDMPWPEEYMVADAGVPTRFDWRWGEMRVPNTKGQWPEELGGVGYSPRTNHSWEWMERLAEDVLPLWPDPEDPSKEREAAGITEMFAYFPQYLSMSWSIGGHTGWWIKALVGPKVPLAMAHFVHVPGGPTNKLTLKQAIGYWNWTMSHLAHQKYGVFFASRYDSPVPPALAYSPGVLAGRSWATEADFAAAVYTLVRLALETERAAVYFAPYCKDPWIAGGADNTRLPLQMNHAKYIPYGTWEDLRCMWGGYLHYECQRAKGWKGGLLPLEFNHYLDLVPQSRRATVTLPAEFSTGAHSVETVAAEIRKQIEAAAAMDASSSAAGTAPQLVYLNSIPQLTDTLGPAHTAYIDAVTKGPQGHRCELIMSGKIGGTRRMRL